MTRILLVEDNEMSTGMIRRMFTVHSIDHVTSLADAIEHLSTSSPDIIFLDLNLPDSSGGDTYHTIRDLRPEIYTIVFTGIPLDCKDCLLLPRNVQIAQKGDIDLFQQLNSINIMLDRLM